MGLKSTDEQKAIFKFVDKRTENLLIEAYAGCGKTTTIVNALKLLPKFGSQITFLAFNKHIKEELDTKIPEHVRCYTAHGLGLSAIKRKYGSIEFNEYKADVIIKKKASRWNLDTEFKNYFEKQDYLNNIKKLANLCRLTLTFDKKFIGYLAEKHDIKFKNFDTSIKRTMKVLETMTNDKTMYDFTDMVFLPAVDPKIWLFPQDYVIIDEAQDWNRAQQKLIEKMLKKDKVTKKIVGRLIAVGDEKQSIYGFNGVSDKSFDWFRKFPNTKTLKLSHTFRCGKNIVKEAQKIVPDIKALPSMHNGIVRDGDVLTEPESGDFILCRTTAPLVKLFFHFLVNGEKATIKGSDIGLSLIDMIGDFKNQIELVNHWRNKLSKLGTDLKNAGVLNFKEESSYINLDDKVTVLSFLTRVAKDVPDLINKIKQIFTDEIEGIILSTVHKSKGLEADRVFIIKPDKLPMQVSKPWQYQQEMNLKYVAVTRARKELIFDPVWDIEEEE